MKITLSIINASGQIRLLTEDQNEALLVAPGGFVSGDRIALSAENYPCLLSVALGNGMAPALVWLTGSVAIEVPDGEGLGSYPSGAFGDSRQRLFARLAHPAEAAGRRNLALNPWDRPDSNDMYPHASANVETRGESVFFARNAIDGETANNDHGFWPYTSWGINQNPQATLKIDFGRAVELEEIALRLRADFPHDAWWTSASIIFSDGSEEQLKLRKTGARQSFSITPRVVRYARLERLIKAEDPSPFPALTQIELWGQEVDLVSRLGCGLA